MGFAEYVSEHPEKAIQLAEMNREQGTATKSLYDEWKEENAKEGMFIIYWPGVFESYIVTNIKRPSASIGILRRWSFFLEKPCFSDSVKSFV